MEASKDVNFGQKMANGTWDGMRGQLVRQVSRWIEYK